MKISFTVETILVLFLQAIRMLDMKIKSVLNLHMPYIFSFCICVVHCDILSELQLIVENDRLSGKFMIITLLLRVKRVDIRKSRRETTHKRPTLLIMSTNLHIGGSSARSAPVRLSRGVPTSATG